MDFSFNRKQFITAVKKVAKIVPSSSPINELTGILIQADAENFEVSLLATCLEMSAKYTLPVAVSKGGAVVVNASLFHELLNSFSGDIVICRVNKNFQMQLLCGKTECVIPTLPAKNFPKLELNTDLISENSVEIEEIDKLARQTVFAADKNNTNMALKCVKIGLGKDGFRAVACDGNRMISVSSLKEETASFEDADMSFLIPASSFSKLASMVEEKERFKVCLTDRNVIFSTDNFIFSAKCVDEVYIDVDVMLKAFTSSYEAIVGAKALETAVETVSVVDSASSGVTPVKMVFQLGCIVLETESAYGKSNISVNAEVGSATSADGFYFQTNKLLQCLKSMEGNIRIQLSVSGIMLITSECQTYMQVSVRPSAVKKDGQNAKPKKKTSNTKKKADNAA